MLTLIITFDVNTCIFHNWYLCVLIIGRIAQAMFTFRVIVSLNLATKCCISLKRPLLLRTFGLFRFRYLCYWNNLYIQLDSWRLYTKERKIVLTVCMIFRFNQGVFLISRDFLTKRTLHFFKVYLHFEVCINFCKERYSQIYKGKQILWMISLQSKNQIPCDSFNSKGDNL